MTAGLGANVARRVGATLYLDIRDLFTLNMDEILAGSMLKLLLPVFRGIERRAFRSAKRISVVSEGFLPHIRTVAPDVSISCFTNGIDDIFLAEDFTAREAHNGPPLVLYAGNMGEGQGLHHIVPAVAKEMEGRVQFRLIGDGGKRRELETALAAHGVSNVELLPPISRAELIAQYREAEILFLHLNDLDAFRKVLPSKLFEYAATGRPILAGVAGFAADFTAANLPDAEVFAPCDVRAMVAALERLITRKASIDRTQFCQLYARQRIMADMASDVLATKSS
jgi:glycosyltransferase involved in cell wall biosynthesis